MIVKRIKELTEKRDAKLNEASVLVNKARTEKRELTADEIKSVETIQNEAEQASKTLAVEARQLALESQKPTKLSDREERDIQVFDYKKLVNHMHRSMRGTSIAPLDGIEAEMVQEGEREAREAGIEINGVALPRLLVRRGVERRDVSATGQTSVAGDQGGMTIQTSKAGLLDDFFNRSVLRAAGATVLEGLVGNLDIPRIVADSTKPLKKTENESAGEYTPTTAMLSLSPNRLPAFIDVGEQLLKQSSSAIEAILRSTITNEMLAVQEAAFFHGGGTSEANGIAGTSGIGSVAGGTDGLAPAWSHIVGLETAVDTNNALLGNLHYISNGQIRGKLKQTPVVASTDSRMILGDSGLLNGYAPFFTNAVSRTLTKGSGSGVSVCSAIFFGNFADYWIGYWGGISLEMIRDSASAKVGQYCLVGSAYYDGGVVRPKSFAAMLDALGA
jgi:HK97 family phage major capsid protein